MDNKIVLESEILEDEITKQIGAMFDYESGGGG